MANLNDLQQGFFGGGNANDAQAALFAKNPYLTSPPDVGAKYWTVDPSFLGTSTQILVTGSVYVSKIPVSTALSVSFDTQYGLSALGVTPGTLFFAYFSGPNAAGLCTQIAATSDQSANVTGSTGTKTIAANQWTLNGAQTAVFNPPFVYGAILVGTAFGTNPTLRADGIASSTLLNGFLTAGTDSLRGGIAATGQTTMPTSFNISAITSNVRYYLLGK